MRARAAAQALLLLAGCEGGAATAPACQRDRLEAAYPSCGACMLGPGEVAVDVEDRAQGYSAREMIADFNRSGDGTLVWYDGSSTRIHLAAAYNGGKVEAYRPPPGQGYCWRSLRVSGLSITLHSEDGRLDETVTGQLFATDRGAGRDSLMLEVEGGIDTDHLHGTFAPHAAWSTPERSIHKLHVITNIMANRVSPYCLPGEIYDKTPTSYCTRAAGKLIYASYSPRYLQAVEGIDPSWYFDALAGTWTWP